jgi:hypothetical protein
MNWGKPAKQFTDGLLLADQVESAMIDIVVSSLKVRETVDWISQDVVEELFGNRKLKMFGHYRTHRYVACVSNYV